MRHAEQRYLGAVMERPRSGQALEAGGDPAALDVGEAQRHVARHAQRRGQHDAAAGAVDPQRDAAGAPAADEGQRQLGIGVEDRDSVGFGQHTPGSYAVTSPSAAAPCRRSWSATARHQSSPQAAFISGVKASPRPCSRLQISAHQPARSARPSPRNRHDAHRGHAPSAAVRRACKPGDGRAQHRHQLLLLLGEVAREHAPDVQAQSSNSRPVEQVGGHARNRRDLGEARLNKRDFLGVMARGNARRALPVISRPDRLVASVTCVRARAPTPPRRRGRSGSSRRCRRGRSSRPGSWRGTAGGSPRRSRTAARRGSRW